MQKPIYSAKEEQTLMTNLWSSVLRDDPELFVRYAFPWGEKNTPLEFKTGPRKWQTKILRKIKAHILVNKGQIDFDVIKEAIRSGRGIGKSCLIAWLILWMLTTRIGSSVIVSANSENQLRSVTWGELTKWSIMCIHSHWWEISATRLVPAKWLTDLVERDLKKGTRYWGAEGKLWSEENPDSYAGVHNHDGVMLIFDEASGIPDSIWAVAKGYFTEKIPDRYWFAFSNPRRNTGYFHECFNNKSEFWNTHTIDARDVEDTDKRIYEEIMQEYGEDSDEARVEVYGLPPDIGEDQFMSAFDIEEACKRKVELDKTAPLIVGVDPSGGKGRDSTAIVFRQGRQITKILRYKEGTMSIVGRVIDIIREYNPAMVNIDEGGLGVGIIDRLHEQRYKVVRAVNSSWKSKKPAQLANKRAEIWTAGKTWLKTGSIPNDKVLKRDLLAPKKKFNSKGAVLVESKEEMRSKGIASPDSADAFTLTFAFDVAHLKHETRIVQRITMSEKGVATSWMSA